GKLLAGLTGPYCALTLRAPAWRKACSALRRSERAISAETRISPWSGASARVASPPEDIVPAVFASVSGATNTSVRATPHCCTRCSTARSAASRVANVAHMVFVLSSDIAPSPLLQGSGLQRGKGAMVQNRALGAIPRVEHAGRGLDDGAVLDGVEGDGGECLEEILGKALPRLLRRIEPGLRGEFIEDRLQCAQLFRLESPLGSVAAHARLLC